ncbi:hypothetical protein MZM54_00525 [[Brevibacterium] frigoritolerans]|nr:hypothetical protein [Peribacillus frigoritolerans]
MAINNLTELKEALYNIEMSEAEGHFNENCLRQLSEKFDDKSYLYYNINDDRDIVVISLGKKKYYAYLETTNLVIEKISFIESIFELTESVIQETIKEIKRELTVKQKNAKGFLESISSEKMVDSISVETEKGSVFAKVVNNPGDPLIQVTNINDVLGTTFEFYPGENKYSNDSISLKTKKGIISAKVCDDTNYPSIQVSVNEVLASVIEFDTVEDDFRIHTYSKDKEAPELSLNFGEKDQEHIKLDANLEIIKTVGRFSVVKYYANALYTNDDKENGDPYYGDIYTSPEVVLQWHPNAEILVGYGVHYNETGLILDEAADWYETVDDALEFIEKQ